jgi:oxidase EvaA
VIPSAVERWLRRQEAAAGMVVEAASLAESPDWELGGGVIRRRDGAFFRIVGVRSALGAEPPVHAPFIEQREVGILGFLLAVGTGGTEILLQAKTEPGSVPTTQVAPTVQATVSNYQRRHGGKPTAHLSQFIAPAAGAVRASVLQSEQGTRFLAKYNRNMVVVVDPAHRPEPAASTRWFPLREVLDRLGEDFLVNTDARSVLATAPWALLADGREPFARGAALGGFPALLARSYAVRDDGAEHTVAALLSRLAEARHATAATVVRVPLAELEGWTVDMHGVRCEGAPHYVGHFRVRAADREVASWDQPLYGSRAEGRCILLASMKRGILHFLFASRWEPGFAEGWQYGPTLQFDDVPGSARSVGAVPDEPALADRLPPGDLVLHCRQSDEGGRFHRAVSRYEIYCTEADTLLPDEGGLTWMTLRQVEALLAVPGAFSNEARTLVSLLLAHL